jgi:Flp pilus assembly protein TadD
MSVKINTLWTLLILLLFMTQCAVHHSESQIQFGIEAAKNDLWDEAIFRWEKVIQSNPNSAAAHNNLAVAYERKGDFKKAEMEYEKALQLSPENEQIQSNYQKFEEKITTKKKEELSDEKK